MINSIKGKPRAGWPETFEVKWDFSPENIYFSDDGADPNDYQLGEYLFGEANLAEIVELLHGHSRRESLWGVSDDKVVRAIMHWSNGGLMTPPLLSVNLGCLVVTGGNNRIAICREDGQPRLPFLYLAADEDRFVKKLKSFSSTINIVSTLKVEN